MRTLTTPEIYKISGGNATPWYVNAYHSGKMAAPLALIGIGLSCLAENGIYWYGVIGSVGIFGASIIIGATL